MFRIRISIICLLFCFISLSVYAGDAERLNALKNISKARWDKIASGLEPWPAELFPISYWPEDERKKLPPEYLLKLQEREKKWPLIIEREAKLFKKEYGSSVRNLYDLFLKEQAEMKNPEYNTPVQPVKAKKSLRRLIDIVYLQAKYFKNIQGTPLNRVRVFSYRQDKLRVIPFDILEFTDADAAVLPFGSEGNPKDGDNIFSNNDKLFFMAADSGHQISINYVKEKYPSAKKVQELEISYAKDKERSWVYVASFDQNEPELSPIDNIEFDPEYDITYTPFCYNQCEPREMDGKIAPTLKINTWADAPSVGGIPYDIHERLRIRIKLDFVVGSTADDEDNSNVSWRAWYQGRVINYNRAAWKVSTPLGIGAPVVFNDIVESCLSAYNYINWSVPFDPSLLMKYLNVMVGEELNDRPSKLKDILKVYYLTERDRKGFQSDGVMSDAEKNRDNIYSSWHLYTSFVNTVLMRTGYDDWMVTKGKRTLDWHDDDVNVGNYDNHLMMDNFKRTNHHFYIEWNCVPFFWNDNPSRYNWKNLDIVLKRIDKPLTYRIDGGENINPGIIVHTPNIKIEKTKYKY